MGNCIESGKGYDGKNEKMEIGEREVKFVKEVEKSNNKGVRVKMVLTKEELQWLMMQLRSRSESGGGTGIEDVLERLEKSRKKVSLPIDHSHSWKPSLRSISETP